MRTRAKNIGKKTIKIANSIINIMVLVAILLLMFFGSYSLWDTNQVYEEADVKQYLIYKPTEEDTQSFGELQEINPEVFAWVTVYGTHIDYPVVQGETNMKYVSTNVLGKRALTGSIFLDSGNNKDFTDYNSILYGHHMEKKAMFGEIGLFSEKNYFDERKYGNLYFGGKDHGLEFFAFLHTDAYDYYTFTPGIQGVEAQGLYLQNLLGKAKFTREIGIKPEDKIVLLSTCSTDSTNGRDILVARITDETYTDTFKVTETNNMGMGIDSPWGAWLGIAWWLWLIILILIVLILLVFVVFNKRRKRKKEKGKEQIKNEDNSKKHK